MTTSGVDLLPTLEGKPTFSPFLFLLHVPYFLTASASTPPRAAKLNGLGSTQALFGSPRPSAGPSGEYKKNQAHFGVSYYCNVNYAYGEANSAAEAR